MSADIPLGRVGTVHDVAALLTFLMSEDAGNITAATYDVNGGSADLLTRPAQRMRVTMTNPTADLTALPPVRVEPDARQRIRKALADAGRRIAVLDDDPTGSQTVHDVAVVTVFDPDEIAAGLDGPGLDLLHPHQHPQHGRGRRRCAEHPASAACCSS